MKNFEFFFDVHMDTSVVVNNIKKNFKILFPLELKKVTKKPIISDQSTMWKKKNKIFSHKHFYF